MSVEGATDGAAFETYVEHFLVPTLEEGQVVVMDKTSRGSQEHEGQAPHRGRRSADPFPAALLAPDFSPIEEAFSKVKSILLRQVGARTREALLEATARALDAVSRQEAVGWFGHRRYDVAHHSL